jgi:hypothetical protein
MFAQIISEANIITNAILGITLVYIFELAFFKDAMNRRQLVFNLISMTGLIVSCLQGLDPFINLGGVVVAFVFNITDIFYIPKEEIVWKVMNIIEFAGLIAILITIIIRMLI